MRLTKSTIEQIPIPPSGYKIYRDERLVGFCIRVRESGMKTFIVDRKVNNKLYRCNIGRFGELTVEQARQQAHKIIGQLCMGINPNEASSGKKSDCPTMAAVFEKYLVARKSLKPNTIKEYQFTLEREFKDWKNKPLSAISMDMIVKRHQLIGKRTRSGANRALKLVGALFNFATYSYEDEQGNPIITHNPIIKLSKMRAWYPNKRRRTKIETHELRAWFNAVSRLKDINPRSIASTVRDYLILLLFTGLRREEGLKLIWADKKSHHAKIAESQSIIDLDSNTLTVRDTKNHQDHTLPLPDYLISLLKKRRENSTSVYVFPNWKGDSHFIEPRKQMDKVTELSGVKFSLHDLRRTFISIAESLDIPAYALKRLLNHKIINSDVTAGYIISDVDRLKGPMQKIADFILKKTSSTDEIAE